MGSTVPGESGVCLRAPIRSTLVERIRARADHFRGSEGTIISNVTFGSEFDEFSVIPQARREWLILHRTKRGRQRPVARPPQADEQALCGLLCVPWRRLPLSSCYTKATEIGKKGGASRKERGMVIFVGSWRSMLDQFSLSSWDWDLDREEHSMRRKRTNPVHGLARWRKGKRLQSQKVKVETTRDRTFDICN